MNLTFTVTNQSIKRTDCSRVVADSRNYLQADFVFCSSEWEDKQVTAIFKAKSGVYHMLLENGSCMVPYEVITPNGFSVSVFAGDLITTDTAKVAVYYSGYAQGDVPKPPTPDIYEQIMKQIDSIRAGEIDEKSMAEAVEKYLAEHPELVQGELNKEQIQEAVGIYMQEHGSEYRGEKGEPGANGNDGIGICSASIGADNSLVLVLSDGREIQAGTIQTLRGEKGDPGADGKDAVLPEWISSITQEDIDRWNAGGESTKPSVEIVAFPDGTDAQIAAMVEAHYKGEISVYEHWAVGDTRTIIVNGSEYTIAILDFEHDDLTKPVSGHSKAAVSIQMVDCLSVKYSMNDTDTNYGSWESSKLREMMNGVMPDWFPYVLRSQIKPVDKKTTMGNQNTEISITSDKLWLPSQAETGLRTDNQAYVQEGAAYPYFSTAGSRTKKCEGSDCSWWSRSPYISKNDSFCCVYSDGNAGDHEAGREYGISIGFCL